MQREPGEVSLLIYRHLRGELSADEQIALDTWKNDNNQNKQLFAKLTDQQYLDEGAARQLMIYDGFEGVYSKIIDEIRPQPIRLFKKNWFRIAAAAVILCAVGTYVAYNIVSTASDGSVAIKPYSSDADLNVPAGKEGAVLTLADGSKVVLDSLGNGLIKNEQGTAVTLQDGQLSYRPQNANTTAVAYNTLSTPNGRQFQLLLPDGSKVYLNAASSLTYPTAFTAKDRTVTITGEAFFEVKADAKRPFIVKANRTQVLVLGTEFNINAYTNEAAVKTTLLLGSVKVANEARNTLLKPGEQAQLMADNSITVLEPDVQEVTAWKEGTFRFNNTPLSAIMRQLERWYDVSFVYDPAKAMETFSGAISKTNNLSEVLKMLELTNSVKFKREGKIILAE